MTVSLRLCCKNFFALGEEVEGNQTQFVQSVKKTDIFVMELKQRENRSGQWKPLNSCVADPRWNDMGLYRKATIT